MTGTGAPPVSLAFEDPMAAAAVPEVPAALKEALRPLPATEWVVEGASPPSVLLLPDS